MSLYEISVFLHVVGTLGLFVALGLEWAGLRGIRRAVSIEQARQWIGVLRSLGRLAGPSILTIGVTGFYMMRATAGGHRPWIGLGLAGLILIGAIGPLLTGQRTRAIARSLLQDEGLDDDDFVSSLLLRRMRDPVLLLSAWLRSALALGIVFVMTTKPGPAVSLSAILLSLAIGVCAGLPLWDSRRSPAGAGSQP